jgi:hypothetical protein
VPFFKDVSSNTYVLTVWTVNDVLVDQNLFCFGRSTPFLLHYKMLWIDQNKRGWGSTKTSLTVHAVHCIDYLVHLNYYFSSAVCAVSMCLSVRGSVCPKKLFNGCTYQKMLVYKVVRFLKRIKMADFFLIFLDQICPKWIKLDQTNLKMLL